LGGKKAIGIVGGIIAAEVGAVAGPLNIFESVDGHCPPAFWPPLPVYNG
jgi:hypothetical protein